MYLNFSIFTAFLKNRNIISKMKRSKVTDYAALRLGKHTYFSKLFFFWKNYIILCILKGILPIKMLKILFFPENLKKFLGFTSKFR